MSDITKVATSEYTLSVEGLRKVYERDVPLWRYLARSLGFSGRSQTGGGVVALNEVSFTVRKGEAFGIIGRNGAGKSTLLQIIAGTLKPTSGTFRLQGRVTALLELGSGFNPEFTGRENIYLAGSILGIGREEMDAKVSEIERFADIGAFIEQPVKTYSTGMMMRVAFSVAVAVEPDVFIIDEALSVGDILFQQKCAQRLRELLSKGVTLLVVTHDTAFVLNLCQKALWLDRGNVAFLGDAASCVRAYLTAMSNAAGNEVAISAVDDTATPLVLPRCPPLDLAGKEWLGDGGITIDRIWLLSETGDQSSVFKLGEWCRIIVLLRANEDVRLVSAGVEVRNRLGQVVFATGLRVVRRLIASLRKGEQRVVTMRFPWELAQGQYTLDVGCGAGEKEDTRFHRVVAASVVEVSHPPSAEVVHGLVRLPYEIGIHKVLAAADSVRGAPGDPRTPVHSAPAPAPVRAD